MRLRYACLLLGFVATLITIPALLAEESEQLSAIPIINLSETAFATIDTQELLERGNSTPDSFATLQKHGATYAESQATTQFEITISNYDRYPHHFWVRETLPPELDFVSAENSDLQYNPATRQLSWYGSINPGHLEYIIEPASLQPPYIDLGDFNVPNICTHLINLYGACDDTTVTYNFGGQDYTSSLFGSSQRQLSLSTNGIILGSEENGATPTHHPHWLPSWEMPNFSVAGLWQDLNMTDSGRWHLAILQGYIAGHDVFYVQWHDAPNKQNPNITSRFAIAVVLDGAGGLNGHVFYIYDLISNPTALAAQGYTIGIEDRIGSRGTTYAHAPCCEETTTPQGVPPIGDLVLHLKPYLLGADYSKTLTYTVQVEAQVPETIASTVTASSDSADITVNDVWSTHYLYVREQVFLPLVQR